MSDTYALPVEGYQQASVDPMGYALPVAQPIPADIPRVIINTAPEPIRDEPILHTSGKQLKAIDHDPWANLGMAGVEDKSGQSEHPLLKQLFGLGGEPRVQLWPERMVRAGVTAAGNVMSGQTPQWAVDPETGDVHTSPQMIEAGLDTAALAGTGGLAGTTEATLGSGPFLRPALKHNGKIYKGKEGQQHLDVLPKELQADFNQKAMTGEDISHYNFGFMNHKGQFLNREAALDYAVKEGLVDPTAGQYGALTSTLLSDSSKPGIAIEAMKKPTFYSALEHNVNNIGQAKMTGDQWLGTLANKPGVKPEELQWTGLKDFLEENKGKVVTKEAIQQHLEQNKVELKEVSKGELSDKDILEQSKIKQEDWDKMSQSQKELIRTNFPTEKTKYHSYQLPGGENYREMLMMLPGKKASPTDINKLAETLYESYDRLGGQPLFKDLPTAKQQEYLTKAKEKSYLADNLNAYRSSHWDEPNILAHVRMNDRTIEGKKSLHLEEIQSDWHQQGRERGYKGPEPTPEQRAEINRKLMAGEKLTDFENVQLTHVGRVPDAPFKKTWHELALKRMLREAAEKGYDRLSWTPGEAQAARYDLSKSVDKIMYTPKSQELWAHKGSNRVINESGVTPDKLKDFIGKEAADKILNSPTEKYQTNGSKLSPAETIHELSGDNLKIGGEGMKGFYDKMIPNALEKLGKEHGIKVHYNAGKVGRSLEEELKNRGLSQKSFDELSLNQRNKILEKVDAGKPVHYIDIPQSLKDTVLRKGQPLFSSAHPGITFSQVDHDPFISEDKSK